MPQLHFKLIACFGVLLLSSSVFAFFDFSVPSKKMLENLREPDYPEWASSYAFLGSYSAQKSMFGRALGFQPSSGQFTSYCKSAFRKTKGKSIAFGNLFESQKPFTKSAVLVVRKDKKGKLVYCGLKRA